MKTCLQDTGTSICSIECAVCEAHIDPDELQLLQPGMALRWQFKDKSYLQSLSQLQQERTLASQSSSGSNMADADDADGNAEEDTWQVHKH